MPETPGHERLVRAAEALGVAALVDEELLPPDPMRYLQLAAAVSGAAEAFAIVHSSALAGVDGASDPVAAMEAIAFHAGGMRGRTPRITRALWATWMLRRLQAQVRRQLSEEADQDLAAAAALLEAVHALLSAVIHRADHDGEQRAACVALARDGVDEAVAILRQKGGLGGATTP
jgi:hypothetical protein